MDAAMAGRPDAGKHDDSYLMLRRVIKAIPVASMERCKKVGLSIKWPDFSFFRPQESVLPP